MKIGENDEREEKKSGKNCFEKKQKKVSGNTIQQKTNSENDQNDQNEECLTNRTFDDWSRRGSGV